MSVWVWIGVLGLGGAGAVARLAVDSLIAFGAFPLGTLTINLSGALLLGLLDGLGVTATALMLAGTATLGAFTTFSTWMLESHRLAEEGETSAAWLNVGVSLALGLGAAFAGHAIGAAL